MSYEETFYTKYFSRVTVAAKLLICRGLIDSAACLCFISGDVDMESKKPKLEKQ